MFTVSNIFLAAIIHGLLQVAVLLFNRHGNVQANRLLAVLIGLLSMSLWNLLISKLGLPRYLHTIDYFNWISPFFWGPVLYLYVGVVSDQIRLSKPVLLAHVSFGLAVFVIDTGLQLLSPADFRAQHYGVFNDIRLLVFYVQLSLYLFASYQLLKSYDRLIKENYSNIRGLTLAWLQRMVVIFAAILVVDMCLIVPAVLREQQIPYFSAIMIAEAIAIFAIGYLYLYHSGALLQATENSKPRYHGSPLDPELSAQLMRKLETVMVKAEPFTNNDLRLSDLAELVDVSPYYLSQVINEQAARNFYDFVNAYRVKRAAEILAEEEKANITKVAFEAGFNNRTSFTNAFKRHIGMTPSQYRRQKAAASAVK